MTKAELLAAISAVPDDTLIYVIGDDGVGRSNVEVECETADQSDDGAPGIFIHGKEA